MNRYLAYTFIAVLLIAISYTILHMTDNEVPAKGSPRIVVDSKFMLEDLEEIAAPIGSTSRIKTVGDDTEAAGEVKGGSGNTGVETLVENLTIPWDIAFLPDRHLLVTERGGRLVELDIASGTERTIQVPEVVHAGEGGLLGLTLHPDFEENHYVYLYRTSTQAGKTVNSVVRYVYHDGILEDEVMILGNIPGAVFHDGGRIAFGPDGYLYITTGDAQNAELSLNTGSLAGKILRVTDEGGIPEDNPFGNEVYSYGHRNSQGITWDSDGGLWSTEHGRSGVLSGYDELNFIIKGGNYGWPDSQGDILMEGTVGPIIHSGPDVTWAPASAAYLNGSVFFGGLKGETLYEAVLSGFKVTELKEHFIGEFGRIRTVVVGPDGMLYMTTSNRDGRGDIQEGDDRILRVDPEAL